ncbi:MAG TPA: type II toxin-antitoxin system RelB/DinJ family antitoxin [Nitrospirae bacterium]|nr:type II toxin-antitoxin system RelB/DinJ family antitoxin [Nitrospirota bacterium]
MNDSVVRSRIDPKTKNEANQIFKRLGLSMSDAIRLFLHQAVERGGLPFAVRLPNKETKAAIDELENEKGEMVSINQLKSEWDDECAK